jgi:triacylglycerol lipase
MALTRSFGLGEGQMKKLGIVTSLVVTLALGLLAGCASETSQDDDAQSGEDELAQIGPEPTGRPSRHAIVLAHGFNGSDSNGWSFYKVEDALERDGHVVKEANVQPYAGIEARSKELAKHVDLAMEECKRKQGCDATKVHIVAHSMGGLDSRYLIAKLKNPSGVPYSKLVASLTTMSSPHRGTPIADKLLSLTPGQADPLIDALAGLWARTFTTRELAGDTNIRDALSSISVEKTVAFNAEITDDPGIFYQSWAGISSYLDPHIDQYEKDQCEGKVENYKNRHDQMTNPQLQIAALVVGHGRKAHDGLVSVESAKWGKFNGCIPADHLDEVGQPSHDRANVWSRFDHLRFYRRMAFGLDAAVDAHLRQR